MKYQEYERRWKPIEEEGGFKGDWIVGIALVALLLIALLS